MVLSSFQFRAGFDVLYFPTQLTHIDPLDRLIYAPLGPFLVEHNALTRRSMPLKRKVSHNIMANINIKGTHSY